MGGDSNREEGIRKSLQAYDSAREEKGWLQSTQDAVQRKHSLKRGGLGREKETVSVKYFIYDE